MRDLPLRMPSRSALFRVFGTLVALALLVYLLSKEWEDVRAAIQQIPLWRFALALGLMVISRLAVSARWYVLLRSSGLKISLGQALRITFAGLFASNFLPTTIGGDVVRLAGVLQLKLDAAVCTASLIVDRLVGMAGMAMTLPFGLPRFLASRSIQGAFDGEQPYVLSGLASLPLGNLWKAAWEKGLRIIQRLLGALGLWRKQPRSLFIALLFTWVHMLCLFGFLFLIFEGMGDHISFLLIGGLYSLVYFVSLIPISINGYGLQEVSMTLVFSKLAGASIASGATAALVFRTLMMLASLPGAAFVPGMIPGVKAQRENKVTDAEI